MKPQQSVPLGVSLVVLLLLGSPVLRAQDSDRAGIARTPAKTQVLGVGSTAPVEVLYTNLPGDPTADVPGLAGVHFEPGTGTAHFDRPYGSSNGHWAITANTDLPATENEILFSDDVVLVREGTPTPWNAAENFGPLDQQLAINASGDILFTTNTDGPTGADEYAVIVPAGMLPAIAAQEGQPMPFIGATWGSTIESPVLNDLGTAGISSDAIGGPPTTEDDVVIANGALQAQEGVTMPSWQVGTEFWENFDVNDLWIDAAGTSWMVQGDLTGDTATDDVVGVDNNIVAQEGIILAGTSFADPVDLNGIVGISMARDGTWFVRGNNAVTEQDWIYSNTATLMATGDPIHAGTSEAWSDVDFSDCYFLHVGDGQGNFVVGGVTDAPSTANGVLVMNEQVVIVRESDAFDLDGNGQFDDDTYFDTFGNDDGYFTDDGWFYFVATIKDGTGTRIGQGMFRADVSCLLMPFADGFESGDTSAWCFVVQ